MNVPHIAPHSKSIEMQYDTGDYLLMDMTDVLKRAAAGTAMAGALTFGILGAGSGIAGAKPGNPGPHPNPPGPGVSAPANPGNGHGNGNGNGHVNGDVNDDVNDDVNGDVDEDEGGGWTGGNVNPAWVPGMPPGQNPFGPPGQVKKMTTLTLPSDITVGGVTIPAGTVLPTNPFSGIAPGQWGTVDLLGFINELNPTTITWLPANSGLTAALPLEWNADFNNGAGAWGVTLPDGTFVVYPITLPAP